MSRTGSFLAAILIAVAAIAVVPSSSARVQTLPGDVTVEATGSTGATYSWDDSGFTCNPASGSLFPLGPTNVNCVDTNGDPAAPFTVTVVDTTPPTITVPSDISVDASGATVVNYTEPTATDVVDGAVTPSCSSHSGDTFPLGSTTVNCSAEDAAHNSSSGSFTVTVNLIDSDPPTFTTPLPSPTVEATGPSGAVVTYTIAATDNADPFPSISCDHASGDTFPLGATDVHCTTTDASGNSAQATFTVNVRDTTPPALSLPSDITVSVGTTVTFSATANDLVDGAVAVNCSPSSGSSFPIGTTTVMCSATDSHSNSAPGTFTVTVQDATPPVLTNVPAPIHVEANGASGSIVNFSTPTAADDVDGLIALVTCAPASGSTFALGSTTVTCSATDSAGNTGTATFTVGVVDTAPPHLIPPGDRSVYATTPAGIYPADEDAAAFVTGAFASDIADPHPVVTSNAPTFFFVGVTVVTFTARDASGNTVSADARLDVRPMPAAGTTPAPLPPPADRTPPDDVTDLVAIPGDRLVTLKWTAPKASDFDHVVVTRSTTAVGSEATTVYTGKGNSFGDTGVQNGVEYRYIVAAADKAGNRSRGLVVVAIPKAAQLLSPKAGARVKKTVKFRWRAVKNARYYNLQIFRSGNRVLAAAADVKVLSIWPVRPTFVLKQKWKYLRKRYALTPGVYTWYVWPGFGPRTAAEYGELIGSSTFTVVR